MKKQTLALGLGLAITLGAAGATGAQVAQRDRQAPGAAQQDSSRRDRGPRGRGERGARDARGGQRGPGGMLLRGITLTDAQKQQLQALRPARGADSTQRAQVRGLMDQARTARQSGDSAGAAAKRQQAQALMTQQRERHVAQIRNVLTAEQRVVFDRNVAEMKQRESERGDRGFGPGGRRGGDRKGGR